MTSYAENVKSATSLEIFCVFLKIYNIFFISLDVKGVTVERLVGELVSALQFVYHGFASVCACVCVSLSMCVCVCVCVYFDDYTT